jgi:hypothetical protein
MIERQSDCFSRGVHMITETQPQEGDSVHLYTIMSETKQDYEDFEPYAREIVEDIVETMLNSSELRMRGLEKHN